MHNLAHIRKLSSSVHWENLAVNGYILVPRPWVLDLDPCSIIWESGLFGELSSQKTQNGASWRPWPGSCHQERTIPTGCRYAWLQVGMCGSTEVCVVISQPAQDWKHGSAETVTVLLQVHFGGERLQETTDRKGLNPCLKINLDLIFNSIGLGNAQISKPSPSSVCQHVSQNDEIITVMSGLIHQWITSWTGHWEVGPGRRK